jgi:2-dehydropantoate 2-reductase
MERIAILGPGGVGGFLAGAFERAGTPVTLVAREETAAALARDGLRIESARLGESFGAHPAARTSIEGDWDALLVATSACCASASAAARSRARSGSSRPARAPG